MKRTSTVAFTPRNRLSRILSGPDRATFAEHVAQAETAVREVAPLLIEGLRGDVPDLVRLCRQDEAEVLGQRRDIARLALRIVEAARLAGRPALASVAEGVWEMIDAPPDPGAWRTDALRLHADTLSMLVHAEGPDDLSIGHQLRRLREATATRARPRGRELRDGRAQTGSPAR